MNKKFLVLKKVLILQKNIFLNHSNLYPQIPFDSIYFGAYPVNYVLAVFEHKQLCLLDWADHCHFLKDKEKYKYFEKKCLKLCQIIYFG